MINNPNSPWRNKNSWLFPKQNKNMKKEIYIDSRPHLRINGKYKAICRIVVESVLGRELKSNEYVHHRDGDPLNNDALNLVVCKNGASEHNKYHWKMNSYVWHKIPWRNGKPHKIPNGIYPQK